MDKVDGPDVDKSEWIKVEFLMDPDNPASKYRGRRLKASSLLKILSTNSDEGEEYLFTCSKHLSTSKIISPNH
jgi:hypothetical protein